MARTLPIYILRPQGGEFPPGIIEHFGGAHTITSPEELFGEGQEKKEPGWVLLSARTPPDLILMLMLRLARESGGWAPLLVVEEGGEVSLTPLLLGHTEALAQSLPRIQGAEKNTGLLSFRALLQDLSRIRHDINNPLTAAFAETQLLLMDAEPGSELAESLSIVEEQLYRIRDLTAELVSFRAPSH